MRAPISTLERAIRLVIIRSKSDRFHVEEEYSRIPMFHGICHGIPGFSYCLLLFLLWHNYEYDEYHRRTDFGGQLENSFWEFLITSYGLTEFHALKSSFLITGREYNARLV